MKKHHSFLIILFLICAFLLGQSAFVVYEGEQAMVLQFGKPVDKHVDPGLKLKIPFIQNVRVFEKRALDVDPNPEEVILADQKRIVVDTFARYRITDMEEFVKSLNSESQAESRLTNIINSTLRSTMGNATLNEVLSEKRAVLMGAIKKQVNDATNRMGIEIVDVRIGRADLPVQTSQAIYARMRTEREREAAEFRAQGQEQAQEIKSKADKERTVLLASAEKDAQILRGQGDEVAIKTYADAFKKDAEFYAFYRTMEAYKTSMSGDNTVMVLPPEGDFLKYFKSSGKN